MKPYEFVPGIKWRFVRRVTQALALIAIVVGPILGGWQRAERGTISAWKMRGWDLPAWLSDLLPNVESAKVYDTIKFIGGGGAVDYFTLAVSDPVAGSVAMLSFNNTPGAIFAWSIPIVLALLFGRVFCGWFCPFGVLSRALDRLISLLPLSYRGFDIPKRRPVRWVLLTGAIVVGALGGEWLAYGFLPHVLFQESIYSILLLGGVGAVGGAFSGLVLVGLLFGPTLYCASICPTGAALGVLARKKVVNVAVVDTDLCSRCTLCHRACWLGLEPTGLGRREHIAETDGTIELSDQTNGPTGSPGFDCDNCARCFTACPKDNMVIRIGKLAALFLLCFLPMSDVQALDVPHKPALVLAGYRETEESTVSVSILDRTGIQFTHDIEPDYGCEISVYVVKGPKRATDLEGHRALDGEVHYGALTVRIYHGDEVDVLTFDKPSAPISAPRRTIFRRRVAYQFEPGDRIEIDPVPGVFEAPMSWVIPEVHPARNGRFAWYFLAGLFLFGGLVSLALGFGNKEEAA